MSQLVNDSFHIYDGALQSFLDPSSRYLAYLVFARPLQSLFILSGLCLASLVVIQPNQLQLDLLWSIFSLSSFCQASLVVIQHIQSVLDLSICYLAYIVLLCLSSHYLAYLVFTRPIQSLFSLSSLCYASLVVIQPIQYLVVFLNSYLSSLVFVRTLQSLLNLSCCWQASLVVI